MVKLDNKKLGVILSGLFVTSSLQAEESIFEKGKIVDKTILSIGDMNYGVEFEIKTLDGKCHIYSNTKPNNWEKYLQYGVGDNFLSRKELENIITKKDPQIYALPICQKTGKNQDYVVKVSKE